MDLSERELEGIGRRAAEHLDVLRDGLPRPSPEERHAAVLRRGRTRVARRRPFARWVLAAAIITCLAFVLVRWMRDDAGSISYEVEGGRGEIGQWVGSDEMETSLSFSDGSAVHIRTGARARVTDLDSRGASLLVERGGLHVRVEHGESTKWLIAGGPFEVHVLGTEFDVAWDPATEELTVAMTSGRVRIEGPCIEPATRIVAAPERVRLTCSATSSKPERPASAAVAAAPTAPPSASADATALPSSDAASPSPPPATAAWRTLLGEGKPREALASATASGVEEVAQRASGAELVELGSAARLAGKPALAAQLYKAARGRAPRSDAAAIAAYHLGRMAFDGRSAWAEAEQWFGVYLGERPSGALAPEALGRSMECAKQRGDAARAASLADRYLAAYPNGAHAALARKLAQPEAAP